MTPRAASKSPRSAALRKPILVGRDGELARVAEALGEPPVLVLISGEAGIGKSRLIREALESPALHNRRSVVATCPPLANPFPLGAVVDALRRQWDRLPGLQLSPLAGALRPLFPEWSADLPPELHALDDPQSTRHRLLRALTELIERLGIDVLVVDDAQWADAATLEWLLTLTVTASDRGSLSLVIAYRPEEIADGSPLRRLFGHVSELPIVRAELHTLTVPQTRELVASMFDAEAVSEQFAEFLHERTDGLPLALEESVRLLRDREDIFQEDGRWTRRVLEDLEVPPSVRDSVLSRVERLEPSTRSVLEAAAVLGDLADGARLLQVAELDEVAGRAAIDAALASGLLQESEPRQFRFRHVLAAEAVTSAMQSVHRRRLHRLAAEELQRLEPPPVVALSRHFRAAGDLEAWCRYAEASADLALESGDDSTTVGILLDLLTAMDHPPARRSRLAIKLGKAAVFGLAPLEAISARVLDVLRTALTARVSAAARGELRLLVSRLLRLRGEARAAFDEIEAAIPDLGDRPDLAVRAMTILAAPLVRGWPPERHLAWLDRASALLPQVDSRMDRLSFAVNRIAVLLLLGEQQGWQAAAELPRSASEPAGQRLIALGRLNAAEAAVVWGRYSDARKWLSAAMEFAELIEYERWRMSVRAIECWLAWYTGDWVGLDEAVVQLTHAGEVGLPPGLEAQQVLGLMELARGRLSEAEEHLRGVAEEYARQGAIDYVHVPAAALGRIRLANGATEAALHETGPIIELIADMSLWVRASDLAHIHVQALVDAGRIDDADRIVDAFTLGLRGRDAPAAAASLLVCRGLVAEAKGDLFGAAALLAEAAAAWSALPRPYDQLLTLERRALCLLRAGESEDGLSLLSDVRYRLRDLGARWDADRVARVLRDHGVNVTQAWRGGRRGYGDKLSPREVSVVRLVAEGLTNKQIAEALYLSPRTVENHVRAAMRKLSVATRTALSTAAIEAGLLVNEGTVSAETSNS